MSIFKSEERCVVGFHQHFTPDVAIDVREWMRSIASRSISEAGNIHCSFLLAAAARWRGSISVTLHAPQPAHTGLAGPDTDIVNGGQAASHQFQL